MTTSCDSDAVHLSAAADPTKDGSSSVLPPMKMDRLLSAIASRHHERLNSLTLEGNRMSIASAQSLADFIVRHPILQSVNVALCSLGDDGACRIVEACCRSRRCRFLSIAGNGISDSGATRIGNIMAKAQREQQQLNTRSSPNHRTTPQGSSDDSKVTATTRSPSSPLAASPHPQKQPQPLVRRRGERRPLHTLVVSMNPISAHGILAVVRGACTDAAQGLVSLEALYCSIDAVSQLELTYQALSEVRSLEYLSLEGNGFTPLDEANITKRLLASHGAPTSFLIERSALRLGPAAGPFPCIAEWLRTPSIVSVPVPTEVYAAYTTVYGTTVKAVTDDANPAAMDKSAASCSTASPRRGVSFSPRGTRSPSRSVSAAAEKVANSRLSSCRSTSSAPRSSLWLPGAHGGVLRVESSSFQRIREAQMLRVQATELRSRSVSGTASQQGWYIGRSHSEAPQQQLAHPWAAARSLSSASAATSATTRSSACDPPPCLFAGRITSRGHPAVIAASRREVPSSSCDWVPPRPDRVLADRRSKSYDRAASEYRTNSGKLDVAGCDVSLLRSRSPSVACGEGAPSSVVSHPNQLTPWLTSTTLCSAGTPQSQQRPAAPPAGGCTTSDQSGPSRGASLLMLLDRAVVSDAQCAVVLNIPSLTALEMLLGQKMRVQGETAAGGAPWGSSEALPSKLNQLPLNSEARLHGLARLALLLMDRSAQRLSIERAVRLPHIPDGTPIHETVRYCSCRKLENRAVRKLLLEHLNQHSSTTSLPH